MGNFDWDNNDYEDVTDFTVIPEGTEVRLKCTEAEDKETSTGGEMIAATFVIVEPAEFKNRKIWQNFNTVNKSEKAQNFGRRMVAGWARACGKPNAKNTDQLLDTPFWAKLGIEEGSGKYKDKNTIASYLMPEEGGGSTATPKSDPAPASQSSEKPASTQPVEEKKPDAKPAAATASPSKPAASGKKAPWDD